MDWWTNQLLNPNPAFFKLPKFHLDTEHKFLNFFIHSTMYNWIQPNSPTMHPNSIKSIKRKAWKLLTFYFFFYKNFQNLANSQPNSNWNNFPGQNWGMSSIYQVITTLRIVSNSDNNKRKLYSNPKRKPQNFQLIFKRHPRIWNPANLHLHGQMKVIWIIKITHIRHESNHNGLKLPYKIQHTIKTQKVNTKSKKRGYKTTTIFSQTKHPQILNLTKLHLHDQTNDILVTKVNHNEHDINYHIKFKKQLQQWKPIRTSTEKKKTQRKKETN